MKFTLYLTNGDQAWENSGSFSQSNMLVASHDLIVRRPLAFRQFRGSATIGRVDVWGCMRPSPNKISLPGTTKKNQRKTATEDMTASNFGGQISFKDRDPFVFAQSLTVTFWFRS